MSSPADNAPIQAPYARHVFLCVGQYCDPQRRSAAVYKALSRLLGELGEYDNPQRVKRGITPCLGVCYGGPLLVVYPEGVWYHSVDEQVVARIVEEHLRHGRVVEEYVFHRLCPAAGADGADGTGSS
jgi:(2Fe-2S) ferredoxin